MAKRKATAPTAGDGADLLAAIRARPDEDTPRLIYADWLDENKQPERAEFIRVQCALARGSEYDANRAELLLREKLLLTNVCWRVWGELPVAPVKERTFARGFVDSVALHASLFLVSGDELLDSGPVREIHPLKVGSVWAQFLSSPLLGRVRSLDLRRLGISGKRAVEMAKCDHLANLHELNLGANGTLGTPGLRALLASPHLKELRALHLNACNLGDEAVASFVGCTALPNLRYLNLSGNRIGPAGAARLARAGWLSQLERLDVEANPLGDAGVHALVDAGLFAGQSRLDLNNTSLTCDGLREVGRSDKLGTLSELCVHAIGGDALEVVAEAPAFARLCALRLSNTAVVTERGVRALQRSSLAPHLRALSITRDLLPDAFTKLMSAGELSGLQWLSAGSSAPAVARQTEIGSVLGDAVHFTNLHRLHLDAGSMTDDDLVTLSGCAHFANLTDLRIQTGRVTAAGMDPFLESPHFARLRRVHLPLYVPGNDPLHERIAARFGDGVFSYH